MLRHVNREAHLKKVQTVESCSKLVKYTFPRTGEMAQLEAQVIRELFRNAIFSVLMCVCVCTGKPYIVGTKRHDNKSLFIYLFVCNVNMQKVFWEGLV